MNTLVTSASFSGTYGRSYCFRVRAVDNANNVSAWSERCTSVPVKAASFSYSTGWHALSNAAYLGGAAMSTTSENARATLRGVHTKRAWLVATRSSLAGTIQVLWNGVVQRNINLRNATTVHRALSTALAFSSPHTGTLTLKVITAGKYVTLEGVDIFLS
jgi:hypothetical protein